MQHLTDVKIYNFRSCHEISFTLSDCTPFVGYNNAGKSNIMNAICWLVSPFSLTESDFYVSGKPVCIQGRVAGLTEIVLDQLDDKHRSRIEPFIREGFLDIRRIQLEPGSGKKATELYVYDPTVGNIQNDDAWPKNPTGIPEAIKALFPEPIIIGAMIDAAEDSTKAKTGTTLGKLLAEFTVPLEEKHGESIQVVLDQISQQLSVSGSLRAKELKRFDEEASSVLESFFPGISLHLDIPVPEIKALFKAGTVRVSEKGYDAIRDFTDLGHGAQRSIQMALVRYLAEIQGGDKKQAQRRLLVVEEPELYLHPQAIEKVREALETLSQSNYQVIYTTHSPIMIDRQAIPHTHIVRKQEGSGKTQIMPSVAKALQKRVNEEDNRLHILFELQNSSRWLFSDSVLLTEGKTEDHVLPFLYQAISRASFADDRIALLRLNGTAGIPDSLKVFQELGIRACALADFDFVVNQACKHGLIDSDDSDVKSCLGQIQAMAKKDESIRIGSNGRPVNNGNRKAKHVYQEWAQLDDSKDVTMALHDKMKESSIWLWPAGDIEHHLGLSGKKKPKNWASFCERLKSEQFEAIISDPGTVKDFVEWVRIKISPSAL